MKVLSNILRPERFRQRIASSASGTLAGHNLTVPALSELKTSYEPFLVTNMRRTFVPTRCSKEGIARYGFSEIPLDEEDSVIVELFSSLLSIGSQKQWGNRSSSIGEALSTMRGRGLEPKFLIASRQDIGASDAEEKKFERLALLQGHIAELDNLQVLLSDLPKGSAMVTVSPALLGIYTRVGDYLGVLIQKADQFIQVVCP